MPLKSVPEEIRSEWESFYKKIENDNPTMDKETIAKIAWSLIKKRFHKDKKGKWIPNKEIALQLSIDEFYLSLIHI